MRGAIDTVPRDGKAVILENDASGTYELAHWSVQQRAWIGESGKPVEISPTHWHPVRRDADGQQERPALNGALGPQPLPKFPFSSTGLLRPAAAPDIITARSIPKPPPMNVIPVNSDVPPVKSQPAKPASRRFALRSIAAVMIISSLIGMYFRGTVITYATKYAGQPDVLAVGPTLGRLLERAMQFASWGSHQHGAPGTEGAKAEWVSAQAATTRRVPSTANQEQDRQGDRSATLTSELVTLRPELKTALSSNSGEESAQLMQAPEHATAELRQAQDRTKTLEGELAIARRDLKAEAVLLGKSGDDSAQLKQAAETATAELQQERDKAMALASELSAARRDADSQAALSHKPDNDEVGRINDRDRGVPPKRTKPRRRSIAAHLTLEPAANSQTVKLGQAASGGEQPALPEATGGFGTAKLVQRANVLLRHGNIGAARVVLGRAAEKGSAQATFRLAETFDPLVLSSWRTHRTRGDATKARELYAKAYAAGIVVAKDRSDALSANEAARQ
jgi:murein DD-endopeptidase MepM/ murein hydrolase activator NlpD